MRTSTTVEVARLVAAIVVAVWLASMLGRAAVDYLSGLPL